MTTSLAEQLQRLAVPQTARLLRDKKRPSLLFDPKEAANLDRDTVFEIGLSGLAELQKCNYLFNQFEHNLFGATSKTFERSVENSAANEKLNEHIKKFLLLLSPYFLLKCAHKALEWLVNRYQIHEYNKEELIMLALPYHETNIFVRCLQLVEMRENDKWFWLKSKHGVHIPKAVLFNRCATDAYFLNFVCRMTLDTVKYHEKPTLLTVVFNFYCTTIVGGLEHAKSALNDTQVFQILPCLLEGLASETSDFVAATFVILAKLVAKIQLSAKILRKFVEKISNVSVPSLHTEASLVLLIIYQSQPAFGSVPSKAVRVFARTKWLPKVLEKLRMSGSYVLPFFKALTRKSFEMILEDLSGERTAAGKELVEFADSLLSEVKLEDGFVEALMGNILDLYDAKQHQSSDHTRWLENFLKRLENGNATAFDRTVQKHLKESSDPSRRKNLVRVLKLSVRSGNFDIVEKLYHPNVKFRIEALSFLVKKVNSLSEPDLELLKTSLVQRLDDDNPLVVEDTLKVCKTEGIVDLLDHEGFFDGLLRLLYKCTEKSGDTTWRPVIMSLLTVMCSEKVREKVNKDLKLLFALLPLLLPADSDCVFFAFQIVQSSLGKSGIFRPPPEIKPDMSTSDVGRLILENLNPEAFKFEDVMAEFQRILAGDKNNLHKYLSVLFVAYTMPMNLTLENTYAIFETVLNLLEHPQVKYVKPADVTTFDLWNAVARKHSIPLQGVLSCLQIFMSRILITGFNFDFASDDVPNKFLLKYLDFLLKNCSNTKTNRENVYTNLLKQFLDKIGDSAEAKIQFLCNVAICNNPNKSNALTLRSLRLVNALLSSLNVKLGKTKSQDICSTIVPTILISLTGFYAEVRQVAFEAISNVIIKYGDSPNVSILHELLNYKEEIVLDADQLPLVLYTVLAAPDFQDVLNTFVDLASFKTFPKYLNAAMLTVLQHVNNYGIFTRTAPMATELLDDYEPSANSEIVYRNVLRFNLETAPEIKLNTPVWEFVEKCLKADENRLTNVKSKTAMYPSSLILNQIDRELFAALEENVQKELLNLIVTSASNTQNPEVISAANRAFKKIDLDVKLVRSLLEQMRDIESQKDVDAKRKRKRVVPSIDVLSTLAWRKGTCVLEFLQDKKKIRNCGVALPILFQILKKCLDFDEQASVEYPKQLLLGCILNCCEKMSEQEKEQAKAAFNIELVVQCVRASQNPQTHHHALLVLAQAASVIPQQLLYHIMSVFTFMGSSVLRHDDAYSAQLITKIIDNVIPILISENVPAVLRVFVDALLDIPEHRRLPLMHQLLTRLDPKRYLWLFLVLVFESQVLHGNETKHKQPLAKVRGVESAEIVKKRLDIAADLARLFDPETLIESCMKVIEYLRKLPEEKDESMETDQASSDTFNINYHTAKQFRHYKYVIVTFISQLLSSKEFVQRIAELSNEEMLEMEQTFKNLVVNVLTYIGSVSKTADRNVNSPQSQYWKVMLHHSYDILDSVNALLTCQMFLLVVRGLMVHNIPAVRRRALELLNSKLQYQPQFFDDRGDDDEELFELLQPLMSVVKGVDANSGDPEQELIQQTALLSLKLIVRLRGTKNTDKFVPILHFVTELVRSDKCQGNILASVVLCLAELCSNLRANAIPSLSKLMPALIKVLRNQRKAEGPNLLLLSVVTALQKVLNSLPLFLSPYLEKLLTELALITFKFGTEDTDDQKLAPFVAKLRGIKQKIGSVIPTRVLLPPLAGSYNGLVEKERFNCVGPLMQILTENLGNLQGADVNGLLPELTTFFLAALQFRSDKGESVSSAEANLVEGEIIKAFSTFILKLSETNFRPIYYRLYEWAVRGDEKSERVITFYNFSRTIANNLKGLFVLFAGHFLNNVASLLDACNNIKNEVLYFEDDEKNVMLVESILQTLHAVFLYDSQKFVNKDRFDTLMQPIVDQLENTLDGEDGLRVRAREIVTPCVVQFAVATADDALWKQMNYQILLKTRNSSSCVRLVALECLEEVTKKLGEDFLPLLPETIPFLAEMLEDEDEDVEKATQKAVQQMEKVLGEPLRKYF